MPYYVSPTERSPAIQALGKSSSLPEQHGCDVIYLGKTVRVGFQRKEVADFVASLADGRLSKELGQIESSPVLTHKSLIIEGKWSWTSDGMSVRQYISFSRRQLRSIVTSLQLQGVIYHEADSVADTVRVIEGVVGYLSKRKHYSLTRRPKARDVWGHTTNEAFAIHLLQSFPGIGSDTAKNIYDYFAGVPITWTVTAEELTNVKGVGRQTATRLISALADHRLETDEATCTCIELDNYTRRICLYHLFAMSFREQREWSVVVRKRGPLPFIEQPMFE